jgi:hypothetical protein
MSQGPIPKSLRAILKDVPHRVEKGGKHYKLFVRDKFAGILPYSPHAPAGRGDKNLESQVKKILRESVHGYA